jgi:hypothetical protein
MVDVCSLKTLVGWLCRLSVSQVDWSRYGEYHSTAHDSNRALSDQKNCILGSRFIGRVKDYFILPRYATSIDESSGDRIYTRERLTGEPASPRTLRGNDDGEGADLAADAILGARAAGTAVGGDGTFAVEARGDARLVVDGQGVVGLLALGQDEAVVGVAAGDGLRGQAGDGARLADEVLGVVAAELEVEGGDLVAVLVHEQVGDVDVLGAALGGGGREGGGEEGRGDGEVLHFGGVEGWLGGWFVGSCED